MLGEQNASISVACPARSMARIYSSVLMTHVLKKTPLHSISLYLICNSQTLYLQHITVLMPANSYNYINLDDCWTTPTRNSTNGRLVRLPYDRDGHLSFFRSFVLSFFRSFFSFLFIRVWNVGRNEAACYRPREKH